MANIASYNTSSPIIATDKWIGTSGNDNSTKNFTAADVSTYVYPRSIINTTITTYTFQLNTENKTLTYTGSGNASFTIDTNANMAFTTGAEILVCNGSADTITVAGAVGVTLNGTATISAGDSKRLKKTATDTWFIY
jgi:hypothetical protein